MMYYSVPDCFMTALFCGFAFGLVYEALRIVRLIIRFKTAVFLCDALFFILCAFAIEALSPLLGSYVRSPVVLGFFVGVFAYIVTLGRIFNLMESAAAEAWRMTLGRFIKFVLRKLKTAFGVFAHKMQVVFGKISDFSLSRRKKLHGYLKSHSKKVYNNSIIENKESEIGHVIKAEVRRSG